MAAELSMNWNPAAAATRLPRSFWWAAAVTVAVLWLFSLGSGRVALEQLRVVGTLGRVDAGLVRLTLDPYLAQGFFAFDIRGAQNALRALPWVAQVRVERRWPAQIQVRIWEREAAARWKQGQLIDINAELFAPPVAQWPAALPLLAGPDGSQRQVYETWLIMKQALDATPLAPTGLIQDQRGEWTATTAGGIELRFGAVSPVHQLDLLQRLVLPTIIDQLNDVSHVDLRYSNGFAVGRKTPPVPNQTRGTP